MLDALATKANVPPIPDDPERRKKLRADYTKWYRQTTVEAFDRHGNVKAPWAAKARAALEFRAKELAQSAISGRIDVLDRVTAAGLLRAALDAGADDPLVKYWDQQLDGYGGRSRAGEGLARKMEIAEALFASKYPDIRKLHAAYNLTAWLNASPANDPARAELPRWEARVWDLMAKVVTDPDPIARADSRDIWTNWAAGAVHRGRSSPEVWQDVIARLRKAGAGEYELLLAENELTRHRAFAARGEGPASTVTPEGWKVFNAENQKAKAALEKAWKLDPNRWQAPNAMLNIGRNLGFERDEIWKWFDRAMRANPDNVQACVLMLDYLLPKWHGSVEEYLGFAWRCVRTKNTTAYLPMAAVFKFKSEVKVDPGKNDPAAGEFYSDPYVWHIIRRAFELHIAAAPADTSLQSQYAYLACVAGRYDIAHAQFEALGDKYWLPVFGNEEGYKKLRAEARARAK